MLVVVGSAVGSQRRYLATSLDILPGHGGSVEGPDIVHVEGILIMEWVPA